MIHFPLHPETPPEGRTLADMFGPGKDIDVMKVNMKSLMEQEGLYNLPSKRQTIFNNPDYYVWVWFNAIINGLQ